MATTIISGATGSQNILSNQRVLDVSDKIYLLEPNAAPLYVLVSKLNKRVAINTTVTWIEDVLAPAWTTLAVSATSAATGLTATNGYFNKYDLVKIPVTGEIILVTAQTTTAVTVVRGLTKAIAHVKLHQVLENLNNSISTGGVKSIWKRQSAGSILLG